MPIDLETWKRRKLFEHFTSLDRPHLSICSEVNVQNLLALVKELEIPFFQAMLYLVSMTLNSHSEFKQRIRDLDDGLEVVEHDLVHPRFTVATNDELFNFCQVEFLSDSAAFFAACERRSRSLMELPLATDEPGKDEVFYVSCLPWLSFTSVTHPINLQPIDSIPRFVWGKYKSDGSMPLSVHAHHALVDGRHIARFFLELQEHLDASEDLIKLR